MNARASLLLAGTLSAALTVGSPAAAQQQGDQITVPFSDPTRPGSLQVSTLEGTVTIRAANRRDVLITTRSHDDPEPRGRRSSQPSGGLRRLAPATGYDVVEENNQMVISTSVGHEIDFVIQVPTKTNLKLNGVNGGAITVEGVDGDIEVNNTNDSIVLTDVAGSVVAHSVNSDVKATLTRVTPQKPMAFTSLNGDVDVTLPASLKGTFKLRSDMGDVFTDFDLQLRTETAASQNSRREGGKFRIEVNRAITGTLNGGGPDIELRTFNGDVYLRKGRP